MRFGHTMHRHFVPEWSEHYVDYNLLKCLIKLSNLPGTIALAVSSVCHLVLTIPDTQKPTSIWMRVFLPWMDSYGHVSTV